jgi:hypothetical protein
MRGIFVFILCAFLLFACQQKPSSVVKKENAPRVRKETSIKFEEEMHNFGKLSAGEIVLFTFVFVNTGNNNFEIKKIDCDCGCVNAHFEKKPVKPGETGTIEIEFDTSGLFGKQFKTIEIHGNSTDLKHLAIFAEVNNEMLDIKY